MKIVTMKWRTPGYRMTFEGWHVNTMRNMFREYCALPHEFVCITDDPSGIDDDIRTIPIWDDHAALQNPMGARWPSCYRRLRLFAPEMRELIGGRFLMIDLDAVILADITDLVARTEDLVLWKSPHPPRYYSGAMLMMDPGCRAQVWDTFDPGAVRDVYEKTGFRGSDQAWVSHVLGPNEATWGKADGVRFFSHLETDPPKEARVLFTTSLGPPWASRSDAVRSAYMRHAAHA